MDADFCLLAKDDLWWGSFKSFREAGFINGCSCRLHGESALRPGTLNLALHVGDEAELVLRNRQRFGEAVGLDYHRLTTCAQVHGSRVVQVTPELVGRGALSCQDTIPDTDGLVTDLPGVPLMLFFADCVPILLADPVTGAIGLAHGGWRGTAGKIALKTVRLLQERFGVRPENLLAGLGPSIGPCCYEVDDKVRDSFPGYEEFFTAKGGGKYWLDLWGVNQKQLREAGVGRISVAGCCTSHNPELFCSYRAEKGRTGRMGVVLCRSSL